MNDRSSTEHCRLMGSSCCRSSFFLRSTLLNDRALLLKIHLQRQLADLGVQVFQLRFIGCLTLLAAAKHGIGLLKQLFLPVLDLILVYIKLLGQLRQRLVALIAASATLALNPGK